MAEHRVDKAHGHSHKHDERHRHEHDKANCHEHKAGQRHSHSHAHTHGHSHTHAHEATNSAESGNIHIIGPHIATAKPEIINPILTVRANSGLSGDMLLAGLADLAGLDNASLQDLVQELGLSALDGTIEFQDRQINHIAGVGLKISLPEEHAHRSLADIVKIIRASQMPAEAREMAEEAFTILARAEGAVHGIAFEDVCFHEVGALDSILDICLSVRIFLSLAPGCFVASPLPLADGLIRCAHGTIPAPAPAVLHMLEGIPVQGFKGRGETVTPTALCLLKAMRANFGPWPAMRVCKTVLSYGEKYFPDLPNGAIWSLGEALTAS